MPESLKLAVLGGSSIASPQLVEVLARRTDRPSMLVTLIGRTEAKLERVAALCTRLAERARVPLAVNATTNAARGLEGSRYILNQVRVGGYEARARDETFPHAFGVPGEETVGPGGLANALRSIPVVLDYCRLLEKWAPESLLINLTNPNSFIQYAALTYTRVQALGVCDSPIGLAQSVARLLGAAMEDVWVGYVGMHHFGWVTQVRWKGREVMPEVLARLEAAPGLPVEADLLRAIGAIPTSYLKYFYHPNRMLDAQRGSTARAEQLARLEAQVFSDYGDARLNHLPPSLEARGAHWYQDIVVPVLLAHFNNSRTTFVLNLANGTVIPWLPPQAIVELPAVVTSHGFYPLQPASAPPDVQAMLRMNAAMEMLWVEAVVERSREKALRAMMLNPLVRDVDQARGILDHIWPTK